MKDDLITRLSRDNSEQTLTLSRRGMLKVSAIALLVAACRPRGGVPQPPTPLIAVGSAHSMVLDRSGDLWVWGCNYSGQLGDGTTTNKRSPIRGPELTGIVSIAAGANHSMALGEDGIVWAWGHNQNGQLGDGTSERRYTPTQVRELTDAITIAGGANCSFAIRRDGTVWAWGVNDWGELGDGTTWDSFLPGQTVELTDVVSVAADTHALALKRDGTVWAWGHNSSGELGNGVSGPHLDSTTPVRVLGMTHCIAVAVGGGHSIAVKEDGTVWVWGSNFFGQLGNGALGQETSISTPIEVLGLPRIIAVAAGNTHDLALAHDGTVWAWGCNASGRLGDGTDVDRLTPVQVRDLTNVVAVGCGYAHSVALKEDGTIWTWGHNASGQLGDGTTEVRYTPTLVMTLAT